MGFKKKTQSGSGSGSGFIKKTQNPTQITPGYIYIITKLPSHIYIVKNPKLFYSSPRFNSHLCLSLFISQLSHTHGHKPTTHTTTSPQADWAVKHKHSPLPLSSSSRHRCTGFTPHSRRIGSLLSQLRFVLAVADLTLSHSPLPLSSSSPMATSVTRPHSTSFSIFFLFLFFWVQFASIMWVCVCLCVYDFWKGNMKTIDLKFVFGLWFWKGKS